jgi:hypothetical protein
MHRLFNMTRTRIQITLVAALALAAAGCSSEQPNVFSPGPATDSPIQTKTADVLCADCAVLATPTAADGRPATAP